MMSTQQVFTRVVIYALVLSAIDAITGRFFQAHPDPNVLLFLGGTAWVSYRLAAAGQERLAVPAGLGLFVLYAGAFVLWTALLVGWNGSVPWRPRSTTWAVVHIAAAPVVALLARFTGSRAARATATIKPASD